MRLFNRAKNVFEGRNCSETHRMSLFRKLFGRLGINAKQPQEEVRKPQEPAPVHIAELPVPEGPVAEAPPEPDLPEPFTSKNFRFVAIDVETANEDIGSICQIGLAGVDYDGEIETFSFYIDNDDDFSDFNVELHGIDEDTVLGARNFNYAIMEIRQLLERHPLIQHSTFDQRALDRACMINTLPKIRAKWHDSVKIAQRAWPELKGQGGHGLANLAMHLRLNFYHHDAGEDARIAAQIVLMAEEVSGQTFELLSQPARQKMFPPPVKLEGNKNGPLYGHTACFTGALSMSRSAAATAAARAGIEVKPSVSKKTTLLVVGDQDLELLAGHTKSTKHRRAEELLAEGHAIRIIGETEFLALLKT